jgi:hypothetical protein
VTEQQRRYWQQRSQHHQRPPPRLVGTMAAIGQPSQLASGGLPPGRLQRPWSYGGGSVSAVGTGHVASTGGEGWDQDAASIADGGELLMAMSWRLQRLARGFGHQGDSECGMLQGEELPMCSVGDVGDESNGALLQGQSGGGVAQLRATWQSSGSAAGNAGGCDSLRMSTRRSTGPASPHFPVPLPLPGGLMPPPQSLEDGEAPAVRKQDCSGAAP